MEYYKLLQLDREPFSNSPDPDYFFQSGQHLVCLQKLELALRLKRGLNVVIGDVGTGKTTLCRQLIRKFSHDQEFESHLILDPSFSASRDFLEHIYELICEQKPPAHSSDLDMKESIKRILFQKGVDQGKTLVLIIDEGQKITGVCMEILREFLNFETNTYKLLQIVIFAQLEFQRLLDSHANFSDRINLLHYLQPMNFRDTRRMVQHRLRLACSTTRPKKLFTFPALWAIYRASKGYPRKIIHLCHQSLLAMIIQNRGQAGWRLIHSCKKRIGPSHFAVRRLLSVSLLAALGLLIIVGFAPEFIARKSEKSNQNGAVIQTPVYPVPIRNEVNAVADADQTAQPAAESTSSSIQDLPLVEISPSAVAEPFMSASDPPVAASAPEFMTAPLPILDDSRPKRPSILPIPGPPELLGRFVVRPGDTMLALVQTVYGIQRNSLLRVVIEANPQIPDPNAIDIGNVIAFPAIPIAFKTTNCPCWWIVLDEAQTLQDAIHKFSELSARAGIPLQIIPTWTADRGLYFQITDKGYYSTEIMALEAARALPGQIATHTVIISNWPKETAFFANPTIGGVLTTETAQ